MVVTRRRFKVSQSSLVVDNPNAVHLYVLAGSDNAVGIGNEFTVPYPSRPSDVLINSKIWTGSAFEMLRGDSIFEGGIIGNNDGNGGGGVLGPEFGMLYWLSSEYSTKDIHLVKHAIPNSTMSAWLGGGLDALKSKVLAAKASLEEDGNDVVIKGILWVHGERDALSGRTTNQYKADLDSVLAHVSTYTNENLLWTVYQLITGSADNGTGLSNIREAQKEFCAVDGSKRFLINCDRILPVSSSNSTHISGYQANHVGVQGARYTSNRNNPRTDVTARIGPWRVDGTTDQRAAVLDAFDTLKFPIELVVMLPTAIIQWGSIIGNGSYGETEGPVTTIENTIIGDSSLLRGVILHEVGHAVDTYLPLTDSEKASIATLVGRIGQDWGEGDYNQRLIEAWPQHFIISYTDNDRSNMNGTILSITLDQAPALRAIVGIERTDA